MAESNFWEIFFPVENTGNRRFCRFSLDFFLIFLCFFTQTLSITNVHHQAWLNCQYNWFLLPELSKNPRNSRFSPEKWHFLNFSSFTFYFFIKFCTLIRNGNAQKVTEPDFVKTFFPAENARNIRGKPTFGHFLEISSFHYFFSFFAQRCVWYFRAHPPFDDMYSIVLN